MFFTPWLRALGNRLRFRTVRKDRKKSLKRSDQPGAVAAETLEDRTLLSSIDLTSGLLVYTGDATAETLNVSVSAGNVYTFDSSETITVTVDDTTTAAGSGTNTVTIGATVADITAINLDMGDGNDEVTVQSTDDLLTFDGEGGADRVLQSGVAGDQILTDTSLTGTVGGVTLANVEEANLAGDGAGNVIDASAFTLGSVTLTGSGGDDQLLAGAGDFDDNLVGGSGSDTVTGADAATAWTISGTNSGDAVVAGRGNDTFSGVENLSGGSGVDTFDINGGTISGTIDGGGGSDSLSVNAGGNTVDHAVTGPDAGTITVSGAAAFDYSSVETRTITNAAAAGVTVSVAGGDGVADGSDDYEVSRSGSDLQILIDGTLVTAVPIADVAGITITGTGDADTLTVDFGGQAINGVIPPGGLDFNGGAGADALVLSGTPTTNPSAVTHTFDNASDGNIDIDGSVINYTGLAPITDTLVTGTRTMVFNASAETITISDDGEAGDDESRIDSTAGELLDFAHPTNALVIRGDGGDDTIDFDGVDSLFPGTIALTVDGEGGTDSVNFNTALTLAGLTVTGESIAVTDAITSGTGTLAAVSGIFFGGGSLDVSGGTVDLTATSGSITGTGDGSPDITAGTINLTVGGAGGEVGSGSADPLEIDATTVNATSDGAAGDDISIEDTATGLVVGLIDAGSADVVVTSVLNIVDDGDAAADVVAGTFTATAVSGIDLETTVDSVDLTSTVAGDIAISETDAITLANVNTSDGAITVDAVGQVTAANVNSSNTDNGNNDITLTSTGGGIEAQLVVAGSGNDVTLDAQGGSITENADAASDVTADVLTADAAGSVDLDTTVISTDISTSAAGGVNIDETDAITLADVDTSDGSITIDAVGDITATDVDSSSTDDDSNDITLTSTGGNIEATSVVAGSVNDVTLNAQGGSIDSTTDDGTADVTGDLVDLVAASGGIGTSSPVDVTAASQLNADSTADNADIFIDGIGDTPVGVITAGAGGGNIELDATGSISDTNDGVASVIGTDAILRSDGGVGSGAADGATDLETSVVNLDVSNQNSGAIVITNDVGGLLTLTDLDSDSSAVDGVGGNGEIRNNSPLTINNDAITSGGMTYTASESAIEDVDNLTVTSGATVQDTTATLTLNAGDDLDIDPGTTVQASTTLTLNIDSGNADSGGETANINGTVQSDTDVINVNGDTNNDTFIIDNNGAGTNDGGEVAELLSVANVTGGGGSDTLTFDDSGDTGGALATVTDTGDADGTVGSGASDTFFTAGGSVNFTDITTVNFFLGDTDADTVDIQPNTGTTFNIDGNNPVIATFPPGDTIDLDLSNTGGAVAVDTPTGVGVGTIGFTLGFQDINYTDVEFKTGGPMHVVIDSASLGIDADANSDEFRLSVNAAGQELVEENNTLSSVISFYTEASVLSYTFNGSADDDTLIIDDTAGGGLPTVQDIVLGGVTAGDTDNPFVAGQAGVIFNAGGEATAGDAIRFVLDQSGSGVTTDQIYGAGEGDGGGATADPGGAEGEILTSNDAGESLSVYFNDLEPIVVTGAPGGTLTVRADNSDNTINVDRGDLAGGVAGDTRVTVSGFETHDFAVDTFSALVVEGLDGNDTITVGDDPFANGETILAAVTIDGHSADSGFADDDAADELNLHSNTLSGLAATGAASVMVGRGGDDQLNIFDSGNSVDDILGTVLANGDDLVAGAGGSRGDDELVVTDTGTADGTAETVAITGTTISGITGTSGSGGVITYGSLDDTTLDTGRLEINGSSNGNTYNIDSTAANLLETELNAGDGVDTVNISDASSTADGVISPIDLNAQAGADDTLNIVDTGDTTADIFHMDEQAIGGGAFGVAVGRSDTSVAPNDGPFGTNGILFYDNDLEHLDVDGPDGAGIDNTYNINGVDLGGSGVGTTEAAGTVTIDDGQGDSTWNIQGNELSAASDHVFNGGAGDDDFTVFLSDGGEVSADSLEINGQAQDTDRDRVILDVTADTGSARGVTMTYADATKASGDLDVAGLTAAAAAEQFIDLNSVEQVNYRGDTGNNDDAVTVLGTAGGDDVLSVTPITADEANVFIDGTPFLKHNPPTESALTNNPGVAGGGVGPDISIDSIAQAGGLVVNGNSDQDRLVVNAPTESNATVGDTAATAGFGGNVYGSSTTVRADGQAFDDITVTDAAVGITLKGDGSATDTLVQVNFDSTTYGLTDPADAELTVNAGEDAGVRANPDPGFVGVADDVSVTLSRTFHIQVNAGEPPLPVDTPANATAEDLVGDRLNVDVLNADGNINIYSDLEETPNVSISSTDSIGTTEPVTYHSVETTILDPGDLSQQVNVIGDNNDFSGADQDDEILIVGGDIDSLLTVSQSDADGANEFNLLLNGSNPIQVYNTQFLNISAREGDDDITIEPYANDLTGNWNIDPVVDGGAGDDDLIYGSGERDAVNQPSMQFVDDAPDGAVSGVSEDITIAPSGTAAGQVRSLNASDGTNVSTIDFSNTEDITVFLNDGSAGDDDALTILGTPDADTFVVNLANSGDDSGPLVDISGTLQVETFSASTADARPSTGDLSPSQAPLEDLTIVTGTGDDTIQVVGRTDGATTLTIDAGDPDASDTLALDITTGNDSYTISRGDHAREGSVVVSLDGAVATQVNFDGIENISVDQLGLHASSGDGGADQVTLNGTGGNDAISVSSISPDDLSATVGNGPTITLDELGDGTTVTVSAAGGDDSLSLSTTNADDTIDYTANSATSASLDVSDGTETISFNIGGSESLSIDTSGETTSDVLNVTNADAAITSTGGGSGVVDPVDAAGAGLLSLGFSNVESAVVTGTTGVVQGTSGDDAISLSATGQLTVTDLFGNGDSTFDVSGYQALVINALGGNDDVSITASSSFASGLSVLGGDSDNDGDTVNISAAGNNVSVALSSNTVSGVTAGDITLDSVEALAVDATGNLSVDGTAGHDTLQFQASSAANGSVTLVGGDTGVSYTNLGGNLTVDGGTAGVDVLVVQGSEGDDTVTSASATEVTLNGTVTIGGAIDRLDIQTGGGNDVVTISHAIAIPKAIDAGDGDDTIDLSGAGAADPTLIGGLGDDTITGSAGVDIILGGAGNDVIAAGAGPDVVYAGEGNDDITGGADDDVIHGGDGSDTIHWATGDGADTVEGDDGSDVLDYSDAAATISVDLSDIRATVGSVDAAGIDRIDVTGNIINIVGSNNDDAIAIVDDGVGTAVTGLSVPLDITGATQIGVDSGTGSDALTVTGNSVAVDTAAATITGATPSTVNYSNLEAVSVLAGAGTDLTVSGSGAYTVSPGAAADEGTILTDSVTVSFDGFGSGTTLNVDADLTLNGSDSDDAISVAAGGTVSVAGRADVATSSAGDDLVLVSGNGDDAVTIAAGHAWATIDVQGGNPSASDTATLTGDATAVTVTLSHSASVSGGGLGTVSLSGIETATVNNGAGDLTVDGSGGADDFTVRPTGADTATTTVAGIHPVLNSNNSGALTINDGTAADGDSLAVTYDDGDQVVSIDDDSVDSVSLKDVGYTAANIATLAVSAKGGADSVTVTDGTTTPVTVDGGGSQNDSLTMQGSSASANTYGVQPGTSVVMNSTTADFTGVERLVLDSNSQSGSVSVTADGAGNQLSYVGDAAATGSATISIDGALAASLSNFASASSVTLDPGDGDDTVSVAPNAASDLATVTVLASSGSDALTVEGDSGADALVYTPGAADADGDVVIDGVTTTFGSVESITLSGQGGSDAITVNATAGDDTITYVPGLNDDAQVQVNSNTSVAIDSIETRTIDSGAGTDSLAVSATDFSDSIAIAGAAGSNTIVVNGAAVTFDHDATAADTLALGSGHGNDSLSITPTAGLAIVADAGDGHDDVAVNGTTGADSITVALNSQAINGLGGQVTLAAAESLSLSGAGGTDDVTVTESGLSSELGVVSLSAAAGSSLTVVGTSSDETFSVSPTAAGAGSYSEAGAGPDVDYSGFDNVSTFDGNGGFDVIVVNGNDAADTVTSTANSVTIKGGAVTLADLDRLELNTGGGDDNVDLDLQDASLQKVVNAGTGNDIVDASGAIDATINGGDGDDNLVGSPVADLINGQGGDDTIGGGDGDDILFGGSGNDVLSGDDGADQLSGQAGNDDLSGNAGVDSLFGGDGSDEINWISGDGNDVVQGGDGADVLDVDYTTGADTIAINSVPASGTDFLRVQVGDGTDQVDVAGVEDLDVDLSGGADDITINDLSSTEMSLVQVDLGTADGAADAAHLTGADGQVYSLSASLDAVTSEVHVDGLASDVQIDSAEAGDTLELTGGDRADSLTASSDLSGAITVELRGAGGADVLTGGDDLEGGAGDDLLQEAYVSANVSGGDGEDTIVVGSGDVTIDGGAGSDVVVINGTSSADVIDVAQTADDTLTHSTDGVFGVGATSETDTISNVEAVRIEAGAGKDVIRVTQADGLTPSQSVRVEVDGGAPDASDRLVVVDDDNGNTVIHRIDVDGSSGSVNVGSFSSVDYDGVEQLSITPLDDITGTTGTDNLGRLVVFKNDGFESNDSLPNATFLGSGANLNVDPTIDPSGFSAFGIPGDEDWYQFTPSETGTLDIQVFFEEVGLLGNNNDGLPGDGNLDIAVFDSNGDPVATSTSTDDNERITVPVVEDEVYYLQVASATGADAINVYSLTAINDPAPVPFVVDLQAGSDTGRSDTDDITFSTTPVLDIYLDDDRLEEYLNLDLVPDADFDIDVYNNGVLLGEAAFIGGAGVAGNSRWEFQLAGGDLQEGHNNFLTAAVRIRDAASPQVEGRGAFSTPLQLTLDTIAPSVAITGLDDDGSDSGVNSYQPTLSDDITSDVSASFTGTTSEADAIVRLFADGTANTTIDTTGEFAVTASGPLDGDEAFADSQWTTSYVRGLNDATSASGFAYDGLREILATAEDIAGNVGALDSTTIFVDTQGPQVTGVQFNSTASTYNVFNPQPAVDGPTPSVSSIVVSVEDLAVRAGGFTHSALEQGVADDPGQYTLVGDNVGEIPIATVTVSQSSANGSVAASTITLGLDTFLADDRYTLTLSDVLTDPAGNALDGESNATGPQATPSFTTGDGQPGGDFAARFTVDSRPELGVVGQAGVAIDANDNLEHDPNSGDAVHRDLNFAVGLQTDAVFAGQFTNGGAADGFDRLGAYGKAGGSYRWQLDLDNDGAIGAGDVNQVSSVQVNGLPVAGDFDGVAGDEIGLFDGTTWYLDTTGDLILETTLASDFSGLPIVGDFDGDGNDDLAVFSASLDLFSFDLDRDGVTDATISFGFPGVNERPVSGDYNLDGIDDIGLTTPNQSGNQPAESLEFYLLQSDGSGAVGNVDSLDHAFSPFPLGNDRFGQYGNNLSVPVFGNFDPPVAPPVAASASSEFDPGSGTLTVTASAGSSVVIQSSGSLVQVLVDGQLDSGLGTVLTSNVTSMVVTGSDSSDSIDLAGVTSATYDRLDDVLVQAGAGDDVITGSMLDDRIWAGAGDDVVDAGAGDDWINGQRGNDRVSGGAGRDRFLGGGGNDEFDGGDADDFAQGNSGNDILRGGDGDDRLNGSGGHDQLMGQDGDDRLLAGAGRDTLAGDAGDDFLSGQGGADTLEGGDGRDRIKGGIGNDWLFGGDDDDRLMGEAGNDVLEGGDGNDRLRGQSGDDLLSGNLGDDVLNGGEGFDRLSETADTDFLLTDTTLLGVGSDALVGMDGATLIGGSGDNLIDARSFSGKATLVGRAGDDVLYGGAGNDYLLGGAGNDLAVGGAGYDVIKGQGGVDSLAGGEGQDRIVGESSEIDEEFAVLDDWADLMG